MKKQQKLQLRPFQKEDVLAIRQHDYNVLIANAPGTGKPSSVSQLLRLTEKAVPSDHCCPSFRCRQLVQRDSQMV